MIPTESGIDGPLGLLMVESKDGIRMDDDLAMITFPTLGSLSVEQILNLIIANGRHKYRFEESWEGCRFWQWTFVKDLEKAGKICGGKRRRGARKYQPILALSGRIVCSGNGSRHVGIEHLY